MSRSTPDGVVVVEMAAEAALVAVAGDAHDHPVAIRALGEELQRRRLPTELVLGVVEVREVLDLGDRQQAAHRRSERQAEDRRLVQERVEDTARAEARMEAPGHAVDPALHRDVLAEEEGIRIALEHSRERGVDRLRKRLWLVAGESHAGGTRSDGTRRVRRERRHDLLGRRHLRQLSDLERHLTRLVASVEVVVRKLLSGRTPCGDEPTRGAEDRVALVVGPNRLWRPIRDLRVGAGVAQVADGLQVENRGASRLANPVGQLTRRAEHLRRIVTVGDGVADLLARGERGLDPARRAGNADAEPVVLAHEQER